VPSSSHAGMDVLYGPTAECNIQGRSECNTQLHSAYTRVRLENVSNSAFTLYSVILF
jgi:hypothetical protein